MNSLFIKENFTIRNAYKKMSSTKRKSLIVVGSNKNILGVLSDGDIRRSIVNNIPLDSSIKKIYNKKYFSFNDKTYSYERCKNIFAKEHYDLIPFVDKNNKVIKIIFWQDFLKKKIKVKSQNLIKNQINVVIMAGGKAQRMGSISKVIPKPLLPYNSDLSLIEKIIENFNDFGMKNFSLILKYKSNLIKSFFEDKKTKYKINFYTEKNFLGTAGGLTLVKNKIKKPFFLTNCDTVIDYDFNKILKFHINNKSQITIITSKKKLIYPYGVCELDDKKNLKKIIEKPNFNFLVNTGCYVISPSTLKHLPINRFIDMNEFIEILIKKNLKVSVYPIKDQFWKDLGSMENLKKNFNQ